MTILCVCVSAYMCVHVDTYLASFSIALHLIVLSQSLPLNLGLATLVRLASILLSLPLQHWNYRHTPLCLAFLNEDQTQVLILIQQASY